MISKILLILIVISYTSALKILGVFPTYAKSHWSIGSSVANGLVEAGHEVTVITPYPTKNAPSNYKEIVLDVDAFCKSIFVLNETIFKHILFHSESSKSR